MRATWTLLVVLTCAWLTAHGEEISGSTCYASKQDVQTARANHAAPRARVELRIDSDIPAGKYLGARVRYGASRPWIPPIFAGESLESHGGELTTTWTEIVDGKPHGRYDVVTLQGAPSSMSYTNGRTGKRYRFVATGTGTGTAYNSSAPCDWAG